MIVEIQKPLAEAIGLKKLEALDLSEFGWSHRDVRDVDLAELSPERVERFAKLLREGAGKEPKLAARALADVDRWRAALADAVGGGRPRNSRQFHAMLRAYLSSTPGHRVHRKGSDGRWRCYYVNEVDWTPERVEGRGRDRRVWPAHADLELLYELFEGRLADHESWDDDDVAGKTVVAALAAKNVFAETPALRAEYVARRERFVALSRAVGTQCWAVGAGEPIGSDDDDDDRRSWWRRASVSLGTPEEPGRVVVDAFREDGSAPRDSGKHVRRRFWDPPDEDNAVDDEAPEVEVPVHPELAVFDLRTHARRRVHVDQLTDYAYDRSIVDRLILPAETKDLVRLLVGRESGAFADLIRGKAGGAVVLLAGPPGTGKTLTAEVYAEAEGRALYSVQCSQLGTTAAALEKRLRRTFARTKRWGAVCLLDEADVYVRRRADDLEQNAVVGVFLRVLEYQDEVLFLTTNRPDDVDDAVASRCVARIDYRAPETEAELARIFAVLADAAGLKLTGGCPTGDPLLLAAPITDLELSVRAVRGLSAAGVTTIGDLLSRTEADVEASGWLTRKAAKEVVDLVRAQGWSFGAAPRPGGDAAAALAKAHFGIAGRDAKSLLKLAALLRRGEPIRPEDVAFARRFLATGPRETKGVKD